MWISLRGYLLKAAREQVRQATSEEHLGAELAKVVSQEMLESIESGTLKNYRDVEKEGGSPGSLERIDEEDLEMYEPSIPEQLEENADSQRDVEMNQPSEPQELPPLLDVSTREPSENLSGPSLPSQPPSRRLSGIRIDEGSHGPFYGARHGEGTTPRPMPYPFSSTTPSLPAPPGPSLYLEVMTTDEHGARDGDPCRVRARQAKRRYHTTASSEEKFDLQNAMALFNLRDKMFYLTKKKESPGQITFSELNNEEKRIFRQSRAKEVKSLLDSGAITILSLKDSLKFTKEHPDYVLTSRYVDRYKPEDGVTFPTDFDVKNITQEFRAKLGPKSRWCVVGWRDPMVHAVERSAPTPLTISMYLFMQLAATRHWPAWAKDVKTAFLQGKPTTRQQKLACRMPADEAFEGYDPRQLIQLETEVYGLCSGPSWWRRSLCEILVRELGYRINAYDRCVLTLDGIPEDGEEELDADNAVIRGIKKDGALLRTQGIIVVEVDDLLEAGGPRHRKLMERLEARMKFGKVQCLREQSEGTSYAGRRVFQDKDWGFRYTMDDYVAQRLKPVRMERRILKKDAEAVPVNKDEEAQLRGTIASINWVAREGRPDASSAASIFAGCFPQAKVADILRVNEVVFRLKSHPVTLRVHPIPENKVRHFVVADSSFENRGVDKPQHGWLQGITTPALNDGASAEVSLLGWRSRRMRRKAGNTLLCESIALSTALGALERQAAMWLSITVSHFNPRLLAQDEDEERGLYGEGTVIRSEDKRFADPLSVAVVDAKSLYDNVVADQSTGEDDRAALEVAIIKDSIAKLQGRLRWIPHNTNPSDHLTKAIGAHEQPLMQLMKTGRFQIEAESDVLERGKQSASRLKSKV